jgi:hypothetical protein
MVAALAEQAKQERLRESAEKLALAKESLALQ